LVLKGTKTLISRADEAHCFIVFTRVNGQPGREGIGCVLVDPKTPGFEVTARYHTMGGENLAEIQFNDVELPVENLIIREDGFRKLLNAFNTQRCMNPSVSLGLAEGAFEEAVRYSRDREAFGRPIGTMQGMRWKIAEMYRDIEVGRSILYRAAASANPFPDPYLAGVAKMYCNEMAIRVTSEALQVHGGYGFTDEYPVSGFFRGARYGTLGGGTTETLKDLVGKRVYDAFPDDGFLGMGSF
jgi:alkylation response protein AidB-like acyl-CoA dehydrogenase